MKVLISAYACEPGVGSELELGWNWVLHTGRLHETWVLTRSSNRQAIEAKLGRSSEITFTYLDFPKWIRWWKKLPFGVYFYYYLWQLLAYRTARRLHKKIHFDLIHHATFATYWLPSFMALLPASFVWGPVGGGESAPSAFAKSFSFRGKLYERTRRLAQRIAGQDPLVRLTARRAAMALATTSETASRLIELGCKNVHVFSQVGIPSDEIQSPALPRFKSGGIFRICSCGRLLHWKGFHLALRAVAEVQKQAPEIDYRIFGDGPERGRLERLAHELNISDYVTFLGHAGRAELLKELAGCDVLLHPSLHESGGLVCTEAMAVGCPVICLDLGGPALQVTSETGIKVAALSPDQVVEDLASALLALIRDPVKHRRLRSAASRRAAQCFLWDTKVTVLWSLLEEDGIIDSKLCSKRTA